MKRIFLILISILSFSAISAQEKGYVTGSLETTEHYYVEDAANSHSVEDQRWGSNSYLKVDYFKGRFSAGLQLEGYFPKLVGYPVDDPSDMGNLNGIALSNLYLDWKDDDYQITIGSFYDQFGSGLLFRSWEDRVLGLNNAIFGVRASYDFDELLSVKFLCGLPRLGMWPMKPNSTQVAGADLSLSLSEMMDTDGSLSLEGSFLYKYHKLEDYLILLGGDNKTIGWSGRLNYENDGFFFKGEYVDSGKKIITYGDDPVKGNAQLLELGYNKRGLGVTFTGRRLEWMSQTISEQSISPANMINYVPAMCTQYTYMLTTLHPYNAMVGDFMTQLYSKGEIGGQIDAFYNFRRGTAIGGKRGLKIHGNFSTYYTLPVEAGEKSSLLYRDFSFDVEKMWTKNFKMVLLYSLQTYDPEYGLSGEPWVSNIFVADLLYKFTPKFSTRLELQYLSTKYDEKDWMAALLEVNLAPHWSIWVSDMYNHGSSKLHYYNAGASFTYNRIRAAIGYGRYRAGYICSGGVCRQIPAYTGANLTLTASF